MNSELPSTPGRLIYDRKRAARLVGGDGEDAEALIQSGLDTARIYATTIAVTYLRREPLAGLAPPSETALFDYRIRAYVDLVLAGSEPEAGVAARVLLQPSDSGPEFHRLELARWAKATGLLVDPPVLEDDSGQKAVVEPQESRETSTHPAEPAIVAVPSRQARREEALRRYLEGKQPDDLPTSRAGFHSVLQAFEPTLFSPSATAFGDFWREQDVYKFKARG